MNVDITFRNEEQKAFYWHRQRNGGFGGGFGNGKSYVGCQRAFTHLATFSNYGMVIGRQKYKVLKATTMRTFFKICPRELIYQHNEQDGYTVLINKSFIYWMHLDAVDEQDMRGLEINSALLDQIEEIEEPIANVLDFRIGRWDKAQVPSFLLLDKVPDEIKVELLKYDDRKKQEEDIRKFTLWPKHPKWGHFLVPNYFDVLSNPGDDDEFHWGYRYYHHDSPERRKDYFYIERHTDDDLNDANTIAQVFTREQEWIDKYYYGKTGSPKAIIHKVDPLSIIDPDEYDEETWNGFLEKIQKKASLMRILDHGETGITAVGWLATLKRVHIFYREYYEPNKLISTHRKNIHEYSGDEEYQAELADPQIFKHTGQKKEGFFTVAEEYSNEDEVDAPPIYWQKADNNEFATRNRINELLVVSSRFSHPVTAISPAPGIYFIKRCDKYPKGIFFATQQLKSQRRELVGEVNGKKVYSEERDEKVVDHAYDFIRYGIAAHNTGIIEVKKAPPKRSFAWYNEILKRKAQFITGS